MRALGLAETREEIIELLGSSEMVLRTLDRDPATTKEESLIELYKRFRPGEPPTIDSARTLLDGLFFNPQRYDLAKVGRYKINKKLGFDPEDNDASTLTDEDIIAHDAATSSALHDGDEGFVSRRHRPLRQPPHPHGGRAHPEPVPHRPVPHGARGARAHDHAGARRDHAAGARSNIRPIVAAIKEFFGSSQLSQFMDQTNPAAGTDAQAPSVALWARAVCPASAPASRCATSTPPTTAACAPSRRLKARTSA